MMSYKFISLTCSFFLFVIIAKGQQADFPEALSLKQAQEIALKNNPDLKSDRLNTQVAKKKVTEQRWKRIPQLYANLDMRRNLIIPTTPVPAIAFDQNAKPGEILPLKFMTKWTTNSGINARFDIFNPLTKGQIKEMEQQAVLNEIEEQLSANQLKYTVVRDYLAVLIAEIQLKSTEGDTLNKFRVFNMTREQYDAGRVKMNDLNKISTEKNNALSRYYEAQNILSSARAQLLTSMGYNTATDFSFELTDSILGLAQDNFNDARPKMRKLSFIKHLQEQQLNDIQLKNIKSEFLPSLSVNGFYGGNYFDNNFSLFNGSRWYGNAYIGLSLNVPITQGIDRVWKMKGLQLQRQADNAEWEAKDNQNQLDITQAQNAVEAKEKMLQQALENEKLSKQNLKTATEQYEAGRILISEWLEADGQLRQTETDYLQAIYDYVLAQVDLEESGNR